MNGTSKVLGESIELDPSQGIYVTGEEEAHILGSGQAVRITKEFGPLGACDVRVRLDKQAGEWVVEKLVEEHKPVEGLKPQHWEYLRSRWIEVVRFGCQPDALINGRDVIDVPVSEPPALLAATPSTGERKILRYIIRDSRCDKPIAEVPNDGDISGELLESLCPYCFTTVEQITVEAIYDHPLPHGHTFDDTLPPLVHRISKRHLMGDTMPVAVSAESPTLVEGLHALQFLLALREREGRTKMFDLSVLGLMLRALRREIGVDHHGRFPR